MTATISQTELQTFVAALPDVQQTENFGYTFFFVGDDHRLPFVTFAASDHEYDAVSNLDRDGVYRVNIGVRRETFDALFGPATKIDATTVDYAKLNDFLPHPDYARQNFICILSPAGANVERTKQYIIEAHAIAQSRALRRMNA